MRKLKKYICPIAFSVLSLVLFVALVVVLECVLDNGSYAGAALMYIFLGVWVLLAMPVYCAIYSKVIYKEKCKYIFAVYSGLISSFLHFSNKVSWVLFLWILIWTLLFLALRKRGEANEENRGR